MVTQPPSSDLTVRLAERALTPSRADADKIKSAMGVVIEVLESLLRLLTDQRTMQVLKDEGNGKARGPAQADIERTIQTSHEALAALQGPEIVVERLRTIRADLQEQSLSLQQSFEQRAEDFTPRPVDQAAGHVLTGGMLAGLLDAVSAIDQLIVLLEQTVSSL
jgi:hypothetical protein